MFKIPEIADIYDLRSIQSAISEAQKQFDESHRTADVAGMMKAYFERTKEEHSGLAELIKQGKIGEYEERQYGYINRFFEEVRDVYYGVKPK